MCSRVTLCCLIFATWKRNCIFSPKPFSSYNYIKFVEEEGKEVSSNDMVAAYKQEKKKYKELKKNQGKKGSARESATLALLAKFQSKLHAAKSLGEYNDEGEGQEAEEREKGEGEEEDEGTDMSW